tara:strand:- start:48 stop:722 length:675 start_codon:yes stop_codon:yes gene_type:complete
MNPLNHVAIIMDGNGRWGESRNKSRNFGHREGLKTVEKIIDHCVKKKLNYLTLFAFSTENWKRPKKEIDYLFKLLENFLKNQINDIQKKNIRLKVIGDKKFSTKLKNLISKSEKITSKNKLIQVNLALNYGSKSEIVNSIKQLYKKKLAINESNISNYLHTKSIPDPDILIRTGNTKRLSNFLLWQIAYTEIFFVKKLWPDFNEKDFDRIIRNYKNVKRNFGSI